MHTQNIVASHNYILSNSKVLVPIILNYKVIKVQYFTENMSVCRFLPANEHGMYGYI